MTELSALKAASPAPVVVEFPDGRRARLLALCRDLRARFARLAEADPVFSFHVSRGATPRFWIDAVSYVAIGADGRTWSFCQESRNASVEQFRAADYQEISAFCERYVGELAAFRRDEGGLP